MKTRLQGRKEREKIMKEKEISREKSNRSEIQEKEKRRKEKQNSHFSAIRNNRMESFTS